MKTITNWNQLQALKEIEAPLKAELEQYFRELVTEMLDEEDYLNHDIGYIGPIAILESTDNPNHLPEIGMTSETMTLVESIPEYIDTLTIGDKTYYRIIILFGGDTGRVIYAPDSIVTGQLKTWVDTWKEESNG